MKLKNWIMKSALRLWLICFAIAGFLTLFYGSLLYGGLLVLDVKLIDAAGWVFFSGSVGALGFSGIVLLGLRAPRNTDRPPIVAEVILAFTAKGDRIDAIVGDFEERFRKDLDRFGYPRARRLYWIAVLRSTGPLAWAALKRLGFLALLVQAVRRLIG